MQNLEQLAREYRNALENSAQDGSSVIEQIIILEKRRSILIEIVRDYQNR